MTTWLRLRTDLSTEGGVGKCAVNGNRELDLLSESNE